MKTTKKDLEIFKKECKKWLNYFGLKNWRIAYGHEKVNDGNAILYYPDKIENRVVTISLSTEIDNKKDIKRSAFHEVCELLLYPLLNLAQSRYCQPEEIANEIHVLIRIFENTIYDNTSTANKLS